MLSYVKYTTIKLSKGKEMTVAPLLRYTEIPLKFSLMVVCDINISGDIFMYICGTLRYSKYSNSGI